jgi:peptidoglycan/xylan/chitin deacetylase (PgdA/CDA1 family)
MRSAVLTCASLALLAAAAAGSAFGGGDRASAAPVERSRAIALTFDDLPNHAALPAGVSRAEIARSILASLATRKAPPVYGFVNAKGLADGPDSAEVLKLWRAARHPLGNHTFSHMDLHKNTPEAFAGDVVANEDVLRSHMGKEDWRWLRFPYLNEGDTTEKRQAVARFLKERGYRVAQVTMSFQDFAYGDPYARCLAKKDAAAIDWMKETFLTRADAAITAAERDAQSLFGRAIAHVLVLHVSSFHIVALPSLLDLLDRRGYRLVTLQEAQRDAAYAVDPGRAVPFGATLLEQMKQAKGIGSQPLLDETMTRLAELCR